MFIKLECRIEPLSGLLVSREPRPAPADTEHSRGEYRIGLTLAGRFLCLPYRVATSKAAVCPLLPPNGKLDMAGYQVKVFVAVKKAARVVHGNSGDEMIRRRDGQTLESRCVRHPIRRSPDRCRDGELL